MGKKVVRMKPEDLDRLPAPAAETQEELAQREERARAEEVRRPLLDLVRDELSIAIAVRSFRSRGDLAAYWTDVCGHSPKAVAPLLGMSPTAVRVAKWKALKDAECLNDHADGQGQPCAHRRGEMTWDEIAASLVAKFRRK